MSTTSAYLTDDELHAARQLWRAGRRRLIDLGVELAAELAAGRSGHAAAVAWADQESQLHGDTTPPGYDPAAWGDVCRAMLERWSV